LVPPLRPAGAVLATTGRIQRLEKVDTS